MTSTDFSSLTSYKIGLLTFIQKQYLVPIKPRCLCLWATLRCLSLHSHSTEITGSEIDHPETWLAGFDLKQISWQLTGKIWLNLWAFNPGFVRESGIGPVLTCLITLKVQSSVYTRPPYFNTSGAGWRRSAGSQEEDSARNYEISALWRKKTPKILTITIPFHDTGVAVENNKLSP